MPPFERPSHHRHHRRQQAANTMIAIAPQSQVGRLPILTVFHSQSRAIHHRRLLLTHRLKPQKVRKN